jgi:hypothetical protein
MKRLDKSGFQHTYSDSKTYRPLAIKKVEDISEDCPGLKSGQRLLLIFAIDKGFGMTVTTQIALRADDRFGARTLYAMKGLRNTNGRLGTSDSLGVLATSAGLTRDQLVDLIERAKMPSQKRA